MTLGCECGYNPGSWIRAKDRNPMRVGMNEPRRVGMSGLGAASPVGVIAGTVASKSSGTTGHIASGVATGAAIGSVVPVIGTAVGAIIGGVVGALKGVFGNKDVRTSGADKANCTQMVNNYLALARQAGGVIGNQMQLAQLDQVHFCLATLYGDPIYNVDPRYFSIDIQQVDQLAQQLVAGAKSKGPGGTFQTTAVVGKSTDGKSSGVFTYGPQNVTVPNPLTVASLGAVLADLMNDNCSHRNKYPANCPAYWHNAGFMQLCKDLIANYLGAASFPAVAKPVTGIATPAHPATSVPAVPVYIPGVASPVTVPPTISTTADMSAWSAALQAQGASQQQAYSAILAQIAAQGQQVTPQVQQAAETAVTTPTTAGFNFDSKTLMIGGGLALVGLIFATARPAQYSRRRR